MLMRCGGWQSTLGFLEDVPAAFQLCVSERQQDEGHRSSRVFNLPQPPLPLRSSPSFSSGPSRHRLLPSSFLPSFKTFTCPPSPPSYRSSFCDRRRSQTAPVSKRPKQSPEKTDRGLLLPVSTFTQRKSLKVGGPRDKIVFVSLCVCVFRLSPTPYMTPC